MGAVWVTVDTAEVAELAGGLDAAAEQLAAARRRLGWAQTQLNALRASPEASLPTFQPLCDALADAMASAAGAVVVVEDRAASLRAALREYDGADDPNGLLAVTAALPGPQAGLLALAGALLIGADTATSPDGLRMRGLWTALAMRHSGIAPAAGLFAHHVSPQLGSDPLGSLARVLDPFGALGGARGLTGLPFALPTAPLGTPLRRLSADVVVDPPQPGTTTAAGSVADLASRIGVAYDDVPDGSGAVDIQRIEHADGTVSWTVAVPGTQGFGASLGASTVPMAGDVNPAAFLGMPGAPDGLVLAAMEQAGIAPHEPVLLAGHSLAGMVVMRLASSPEVTSRYQVAGVVTFGSPVGHLPAAQVPALHVRHAEDGTPALSGVAGSRAGGPAAGEVVVVKELGTQEGGMSLAHAIGTYEETAREVEASGHPGLAAWEEATNGLWAREGDTVTSELHSGRVR